METTMAKKLTRNELKELPSFTRIFCSYEDEDTERGIVWHWTAPAVVLNSGDTPVVACDDPDSITVHEVHESFSATDPGISFWDCEPDPAQLKGITEAEFNELPEPIVCKTLARIITSRKMTFRTFSQMVNMDPDDFTQAMKSGTFTAKDLLAISAALNVGIEDLVEPEENTLTDEIAHFAAKLFRMPPERSKALLPILWKLISD